jgi:hypothetical protein
MPVLRLAWVKGRDALSGYRQTFAQKLLGKLVDRASAYFQLRRKLLLK